MPELLRAFPPPRARHPRRGFSILSLLMVVLILGTLTKSYFEPQPETGKSYQQTVLDRTRSVVTTLNIRSAQMAYMSATMEGGRVTPDRLRTILASLPSAGDGSRYFVNPRGELSTTTQVAPALFHTRLGTPAAR